MQPDPQGTPAAPETTAKGALLSRSRWVPALVAVGFLAMCILSIPALLVGRWVWRESQRADTPELFATLCDAMLPRAQPADRIMTQPDMSQVIASIRENERTVAEVAMTGRRLATIAEEHRKTLHDLRVAFDPEVTNKDRPSGTSFFLAIGQVAGGLALQSRDLAGQGASDGFAELRKYGQLYDQFIDLSQRAKASQWQLASFAPNVSAREEARRLLAPTFTTLPADPFTFFGPSRPARIDTSQFTLTNVSGQALTNVLVLVTVAPNKGDGDARTQVVWVREWPANQARRVLVDREVGLFSEWPLSIESVELRVLGLEKSSAPETFAATPTAKIITK